MEAESGGEVQPEVLVEEGEKARRVQMMPTLPKAPMFHGSTASEKQKFMKEYEAYWRQLSALETAFFKPLRMPVGACIKDESRSLIAMFDIRKPVSEITEAEWIHFFWEGHVEGDMDFEKVKTILASSLKKDTKQTDANSRVSKLVHQRYQRLEKENMEWMIKSEPKKVVRYLIDALAPEQFKSVVKKDIEQALAERCCRIYRMVASQLQGIYSMGTDSRSAKQTRDWNRRTKPEGSRGNSE
ncbi:hypothetical protein PHMEG_00011216 [Phytophthora megakarya]|uniref:Uncharacterized protein n=1 Tax=Phytophthora megakarya TaxID=4795 RepID=A0A225WBT3_9STRA|nr:hypothetical protein PHMEG_00011216 [Phytophthora megakarya]